MRVGINRAFCVDHHVTADDGTRSDPAPVAQHELVREYAGIFRNVAACAKSCSRLLREYVLNLLLPNQRCA